MTGPLSAEHTVWQGTPSQAVNTPYYVALAVGALVGTVGILVLRNAAIARDVTLAARRELFTWLIVGVWVLCGLTALVQYLRIRTTRYLLTSERLRITRGILSTATEEVELRRVRDSSVVKSFFARLVGLGDVHLATVDRTAPRVTLYAVRDPDGLQSTIRNLSQALYVRYGVREVDLM